MESNPNHEPNRHQHSPNQRLLWGIAVPILAVSAIIIGSCEADKHDDKDSKPAVGQFDTETQIGRTLLSFED